MKRAIDEAWGESELADMIAIYEAGVMDEGEVTMFFQYLVDEGLYMDLGERVYETVQDYLEVGIIHR